MTEEVLNLTPHTVVVHTGDARRSIPPAGIVVRIILVREADGQVQVIPIFNTRSTIVENLPAPSPGRCYLVSKVVAEAVSGRQDVLFPDDLVRDAFGNVTGCRAFARSV